MIKEKNNLKGIRFNQLTVIKLDESFKPKSGEHYRWIVKCDKGHIKSINGNNLKNNKGVCIECPNYKEDLTGKRFNRLVVISYAGRFTKYKIIKWNCKCDCGNEIIVSTNSLNSKTTGSCGCYSRDLNRLPSGQAELNRIISSYKSNAINRGLKWELSLEEAVNLFKGNCYYCNSNPLNGIDRVDNNQGYTLDNCVPCCKICNMMKKDLTINEFINHCHKIKERGKANV